MREGSVELRGEGQSRSDAATRVGKLHCIHYLIPLLLEKRTHVRIPAVWPFAKLVDPDVSSSNFQCKRHPRVALREISRPVFHPVAITRAFFLSRALSLSLSLFALLVLSLLSFLSSFSFRYAHPRERKSRHSRHFRFSRLDRELNFAGKFLSVVFCGEYRRDRGTRIKLPWETSLVWYAPKDSIDFADLTGCLFFLLARFLFRPFLSSVHE